MGLLHHLGNTVCMFEDNNGDNIVKSDEVIQRYYYYPFGAETKNAPWTQQSTPSIRYQYNGKEKIDELGLGWNDYGARNYDALLGRWMGVDALSEKMTGYNPYTFCFGNPISFIDLDGRIPWPLRGVSVVNKKDVADGGYNLKNTVVRTSTYREIRDVGTSPHIGIDYRASVGTDFYSLGKGVVKEIGKMKSGIQYISVEYEGGDVIRFLHISKVADDIKKGSTVFEGQILGQSGNTGQYKNRKGEIVNYPPHLHADGVDKNGKSIDPEGKNYGNYTNEEFFNQYEGDYKKLLTYEGNDQKTYECSYCMPRDNTKVIINSRSKIKSKDD